MLSKIEKAHSPTRSRLVPRSDSLPSSGSLLPPTFQPRSFSSTETPSSISDGSPVHTHSGLSRLSPSSLYFTGLTSQGYEATAAPSTADAEKWQSLRHSSHSHHSTSGMLSKSHDEISSVSSRSNRGSYDHGLLTEAEMELQNEETRAFRLLKIEDMDRGHDASERRPSRQAHKRRKRSASRERSEDLPPSQLSTNFEFSQRNFFRSTFPRSPDAPYQPQHGSISSLSSSGPRHGSYASSAGFSVGDSSITSISSFDKPSPGGLSPRSDIDVLHDSPYTPTSALSQKSASLPNRSAKATNAPESKQSSSLPARTNTQTNSRTKLPPKATGAFVCACCPKKPKRFASAEELRQVLTIFGNPTPLPHLLLTNLPDYTKSKSNMNVVTVEIDSRTRMKQNVIRIRYIYGFIHGLAQLLLVRRPPFIQRMQPLLRIRLSQ